MCSIVQGNDNGIAISLNVVCTSPTEWSYFSHGLLVKVNETMTVQFLHAILPSDCMKQLL